MHPSNLILESYYVSEIHVKVNEEFQPDQPLELSVEDLKIDHEVMVDEENDRHFLIHLSVESVNMDSQNSPYEFLVRLRGLFSVHENLENDKAVQFVEVNGSSVLFSTARETLRAAMSSGPFNPIILPTVSFYPDKLRPEKEE